MALRKFESSVGAPLIHITEFNSIETADTNVLSPGTRGIMDDGREFIWGQADGAITAGHTVQHQNNLSATTGTLSGTAAIGDNTVTDTGGFSTVNGVDVKGWIFRTTGGTGAGQVKWAERSLGDDRLVLTEPLDLAVDATTTWSLTSVYEFEQHAAAATPVVGVSVNTLADDDFSWFQISGVAKVIADVSQDTIVVGRIVTQSTAAAGLVEGPTGAGVTAADLEAVVGYSLVGAPSADEAIPVKLNISGPKY